MKVWGISEEEARVAAAKVGVAIHSDWAGSGIAKDGRAIRFRLALGEDKQRYRRMSHDGRRKVAAVCWHGHRDFMRELLRVNPEARIQTAFADYRGSQDFELSFPATGERNIGSLYEPCRMQDACVCEEADDSFRPVSENGGLKVYSMPQKMITACPHVIFMPEHYRQDGSCRCDDPSDPNMGEWGYKWDAAKAQWG